MGRERFSAYLCFVCKTRPMHPSSSQAREMADELMVRNLAAQAEAIFDRHPIGSGAVLDLGCGTGEITERLRRSIRKRRS